MAIQWNETTPSGTSLAGRAPPDFKSVWTSISIGLGVQGDLSWGGAGAASDASAGQFKLGGSRAYYDVQSNFSASGSQFTGRAFLASDTSALLIYDSGGTYLGGTPYLVEYSSSATTSGAVLRLSGNLAIASGSTTTMAAVTFPITFLNAPRYVMQTSSDSRYLVGATALSASGYRSLYSWFVTGVQSAFTITWWAVGVAALGNE